MPPSHPIRSAFRRALRGAMTTMLTLAFVAGAGMAVWQGTSLLAERAEAAVPPEGAPPLPVEVTLLQMQTGYDAPRRFLGQVAPLQSSDLSFELAGRVVEIMVDEGAEVAQGAVLARLDTALLETERAQLRAARAALEADLDFAERREARQTELKARGFAPEEALDQAQSNVQSQRARIVETEARLASVDVRFDKSVLRAPFAGRVAERHLDNGATIAGGQPVLRLMQTGAAEVRVGLPLWVDAAPGTDWHVAVEGRSLAATLTALRPDVDPATRTRTAVLRIDGTAAPFGAVATLTVPRRIEATGAWVPRAALREAAPGLWAILAVDAADVVREVPVEVLHSESARVYAGGAVHDGLRLITGGPHRVVPGQIVQPLAGGV